ncbi:MAG: hypothetical protein JNK61_10970 [Bacteroidia bacterium]|nr:hypothetical protein [Bacteroidia bacterium]HQU99618.1 hypothetical protein [Bacteroidia bacterium]
MALHDGNYNQAVNLAIKKLKHNSTNENEIEILVTAYEKAQQADLKNIENLKATGDPNNYEKIFDRYHQIDLRQQKVKALPPLIDAGDTVIFAMVNVTAGIEKSREKAAAYFYAQAKQLLATKSKTDARQAYYHLLKLKQYYIEYRDVDSLITHAKQSGTSNVWLCVQNQTQFPLPAYFKTTLLPEDVSALNTEWINYHLQKQNINYDFIINIDVTTLEIGPELVSQINYTDEKQISINETLTNTANNAVTDSSGKVVTVAKTKIITCSVNQTLQQQKANALVLVNYMQGATTLKVMDVAGGYIWENSYALAYGDLQAASVATINLINNHYKPFLPEEDMLMACAFQLKEQIWQALLNNKYLIK